MSALFERKTTEELKQEFEDAKRGIVGSDVDRIMRGLPLNTIDEHGEKVRALRQAWSRYHERIRYCT